VRRRLTALIAGAPTTAISAFTDSIGLMHVFTTKAHGQVLHWRRATPNVQGWNQAPEWLDSAMTQVVGGQSFLLQLFGPGPRKT